MKTKIAKLMLFVMIFSTLAGLTACGGNQNEDNTLRVVVSSDPKFAYMDQMAAAFPDINFEFEYYMGGNTTGYLLEVMNNNEEGDLIFNTVFSTKEDVTSHMLDLSGYPFTGNIRGEILNLLNVDDAIYQISGPLELRCIVYNKTLFEENGWQVPKDFAGLLALVKQIREEAPEITPIANCLTGGYCFTTVSTLSQCNFLSTPEGYDWEQEFFKGNASVAEGLEEGLAMTEQLIDAGAFGGEEYVGKWQSDEKLIKRECAMEFRWSGLTSLLEAIEEQQVTDEFGLLPFLGEKESDKLVSFGISGGWSINAKLADPGNEKKLENALRVMEWFTTAEGQEAMRTNETQITINKNQDTEGISKYYNELMEYAEGGQFAGMLYHGYEHIMLTPGEVFKKAVLAKSSEGMREELVAVADKENKDFLAGNMGLSYGEATENFTEEESLELVANAMLEAVDTDLALITHTGRENGVRNNIGAAGKLYKGFVTGDDVNMLISKDNTVDTHNLVILELTGEEIEALLEKGKTMVDEATGNSYAFKYHRVGEENLEKDTIYTVAMKLGDYELSYESKAVETEVTLNNAITDYVKAHTPLTP